MKMNKSFWTYQSSTETPSLDEALKAGAIAPDTNLMQWESLSPGMRREICRKGTRRLRNLDATNIIIVIPEGDGEIDLFYPVIICCHVD